MNNQNNNEVKNECEIIRLLAELSSWLCISWLFYKHTNKATNFVLSFFCLSRSGHPFGVYIHLLILSSTKRRMDVNEASNMFYCKFNQLVCFAIAVFFFFSRLCCYCYRCSLFIHWMVRRWSSSMANVKYSTLSGFFCDLRDADWMNKLPFW